VAEGSMGGDGTAAGGEDDVGGGWRVEDERDVDLSINVD